MLQFIFKEASPNAIEEIRLIGYRYPLSGERICDKHERLLTAYPSSLFFGDFRIKDKAKTLFKYVVSKVYTSTQCEVTNSF